MTAPSVSVIIPAYNQAQYLGQAIQSILDQTLQDFEIIVVNDGSTDSTNEVVAGFTDDRIHYVFQENLGLSGARNTGIRVSKAPYLLFLDADDWLLVQALEHLCIAQSERAQSGVVFGRWEKWSEERRSSVFLSSNAVQTKLPEILNGHSLPVHSALVEKSWVESVGLFDESLRSSEDWDLWIRLLLAGCTFSTISQVVCVYRAHDGQMTRQARRMKESGLAVLAKIVDRNDITDEIRAALPEAYAWTHLRAAAREYREGLLDEAKLDVAAALRYHPVLTENDLTALAHFFRGWACDPATPDPAAYLDAVYSHLPPELGALMARGSHEIASVLMQSAFEYLQTGQTRMAGRQAVRAIRHQPAHLANRGVWSLLRQAYMPF